MIPDNVRTKICLAQIERATKCCAWCVNLDVNIRQDNMIPWICNHFDGERVGNLGNCCAAFESIPSKSILQIAPKQRLRGSENQLDFLDALFDTKIGGTD